MAAKELIVELKCEDSALLKEVVEELVDGQQFFNQFVADVYGQDQRAALQAPFEEKKAYLESQVSGMVLNLFAGVQNSKRIQQVQEQAVQEMNDKIKAPVVPKKGGPLKPQS